jgi:hypothetical protein
MERKRNIPTIELCSGLPVEFRIFLDYTRGLSFDAKPDYEYMRSLFQNLFVARGYHDDGNFDWTLETDGFEPPYFLIQSK